MPAAGDLLLRRAARTVAAGGVIAYPTEAVFGLGCDPFDLAAISRLMALKGRSPAKGLIVIAANLDQIEPLVAFPGEAVRRAVLATWPGPVTWVLPAAADVPLWLRGRHDGLAVRVTAHPVAGALCRLAGPLVSTSANPGGRPPARDTLHVRRYFGRAIDGIVPGQVETGSRPTEIRDALSGRILRAGDRPRNETG